jgi:hypothetical protein
MENLPNYLGIYIVGNEKHDQNNTKLKDAVLAGNLETYKHFIRVGYNPYRTDAKGIRSYEHSKETKYVEAALEWVHQLASCTHPHRINLPDSDDEGGYPSSDEEGEASPQSISDESPSEDDRDVHSEEEQRNWNDYYEKLQHMGEESGNISSE